MITVVLESGSLIEKEEAWDREGRVDSLYVSWKKLIIFIHGKMREVGSG